MSGVLLAASHFSEQVLCRIIRALSKIFLLSLTCIPLSPKGTICIYKALCVSVRVLHFCLSPGDKQFVCPPGDKHFSHTGGGGDKQIVCPRGTNISHTQVGGGTNKLFVPRGQTFFTHRGGDKHFSYDDDNCRECERSEHSFEQSEEAPCRG